MQARNQHDLMRDFADEIPGYLRNAEICNALGRLRLRAGVERVGESLRLCYQELVRLGVAEAKELKLIDAWLGDIETIKTESSRDRATSA